MAFGIHKREHSDRPPRSVHRGQLRKQRRSQPQNPAAKHHHHHLYHPHAFSPPYRHPRNQTDHRNAHVKRDPHHDLSHQILTPDGHVPRTPESLLRHFEVVGGQLGHGHGGGDAEGFEDLEGAVDHGVGCEEGFLLARYQWRQSRPLDGHIPRHAQTHRPIQIANNRIREQKRNPLLPQRRPIHPEDVGNLPVHLLERTRILQPLRHPPDGTQRLARSVDAVQPVSHGTILVEVIVLEIGESYRGPQFVARYGSIAVGIDFVEGFANGIGGVSRRGEVGVVFVEVDGTRFVRVDRVEYSIESFRG
mmetsp:Transcript_30023/g.62766  ORF Transcript_30023/g.62766 Transcript_30023/m.62766 type:complete len:305 (+) Transcript_30023:260-1174(+)